MKSTKGALKTLAPILLWMLLFFIIPIVFIIAISFFKRGAYGDINYTLTLENYGKLFNSVYAYIAIKSLLIAAATTVLCLFFGYPFAYFMARAPKKLKPFLLMLVILPFWTNSLVRTYAFIILLRTEGIINSYLMHLHVIKEPLKLIYNNSAVIIGMLYNMFPFMVLPIYSSLEKLDFTLLDAASDLGSKAFKSFLEITLPLTKGGVMSGCILVFVPTLGYFFIPDLLGGSKVILLSNLIKNEFLAARNWPLGAAISIILIIVMLLIIGLYSKFSNKKNKLEVF